MKKMLLCAATVATLMAGTALPSLAGNMAPGIQIGEPYPGGYHPYPGGGYHPYPGDDDDSYDDEDRISCWEGRQAVREHGFYRVQPVRCSGDVYRYRAIRRYKVWSVRVDAYSGRIVGARIIGQLGYR